MAKYLAVTMMLSLVVSTVTASGSTDPFPRPPTKELCKKWCTTTKKYLESGTHYEIGNGFSWACENEVNNYAPKVTEEECQKWLDRQLQRGCQNAIRCMKGN
jgi:hypothetical protein